jgi:insulysin
LRTVKQNKNKNLKVAHHAPGLKINIDLTESGLEHYASVIEAVFTYIALLRQQGPQEWIFDESKALYSTAFRFKDRQDPSSYCCALAGNLRLYPTEHCLDADYFLDTFKPGSSILVK